MRDWDELLDVETQKDYYKTLRKKVCDDRERDGVYPEIGKVFAALRATPLDRVKVVFVGQDPYFNPGLATGLAFSIPPEAPIPLSLRVIFDELVEDLGIPRPSTGDLSPWAERGVLLLNTCLSVRRGQARSHAGIGWEEFVSAVLRLAAIQDRPVGFLAFGSDARKLVEPVARIRSQPFIHVPHPAARWPITMRGKRPFSRLAEAVIRVGGEMPNLSLPWEDLC